MGEPRGWTPAWEAAGRILQTLVEQSRSAVRAAPQAIQDIPIVRRPTGPIEVGPTGRVSGPTETALTLGDLLADYIIPANAGEALPDLVPGAGALGKAALYGLAANKGRNRLFFHGTSFNMSVPDILREGFTRGGSAELGLPGTSLGRSTVTPTQFSGNDLAGIIRVHVDQEILSKVRNLSPGAFLRFPLDKDFTELAVNKPEAFYSELETFISRGSTRTPEGQLELFDPISKVRPARLVEDSSELPPSPQAVFLNRHRFGPLSDLERLQAIQHNRSLRMKSDMMTGGAITAADDIKSIVDSPPGRPPLSSVSSIDDSTAQLRPGEFRANLRNMLNVPADLRSDAEGRLIRDLEKLRKATFNMDSLTPSRIRETGLETSHKRLRRFLNDRGVASAVNDLLPKLYKSTDARVLLRQLGHQGRELVRQIQNAAYMIDPNSIRPDYYRNLSNPVDQDIFLRAQAVVKQRSLANYFHVSRPITEQPSNLGDLGSIMANSQIIRLNEQRADWGLGPANLTPQSTVNEYFDALAETADRGGSIIKRLRRDIDDQIEHIWKMP